MPTRSDNAKTLLDNLLTAVILMDERLCIQFVNPAAEQLLSLSERRLIGIELPHLLEHISLDLQRLKQCLVSGQGFTDSEVTLVVEGEPRLVELSATPMADHEQRLLVVELRKIRPAEEDQSGAAATCPAAGGQGAGARAGTRNQKSPRRPARRGPAAAKRAAGPGPARIYRHHHRTGRSAAGTGRSTARPPAPGRHQMHNVHSVLEQVRRLVELELPPSVRIERDYDPSIPEFEMEPDQLQQAFLNIVRNAAEALGDQTGLIRIKTRTAFQITIHGQRYRLAAEIKIIDNGPGIPDAIRDTLFYPMITGKEGGTGLGLSIAQNLIDQHKGRIDCISWPGHTEFTIFLPLRK